MNKKALITVCVSISMLMSGCGVALPDTDTDSAASEANDFISSIADNIVSGINDAADALDGNNPLDYSGSNKVLAEYSRNLKKIKTNGMMRISKYYSVITSVIKSDSYNMNIQSSGDSIMYQNGIYRRERTFDHDAMFFITLSKPDDPDNVYFISDILKEYSIREPIQDIDYIPGSYVDFDMLAIIAGGEIVRSGTATFMGKEMYFEDIDAYGIETVRYYFDENNTMYHVDGISGRIDSINTVPDAYMSVPQDYKEVSYEQLQSDASDYSWNNYNPAAIPCYP